MAALTDAKVVGGSSGTDGIFSNEERWIKVEYDFDNDAGAQGDYDVLTNGSSVDYVITDMYISAETAMTSGGSAVIDLGIGAGGTEFLSDKAFDGIAVGAISGMDTAAPVKLAASGKVVIGIEAADLTAGVWHMYFKLKQIVY